MGTKKRDDKNEQQPAADRTGKVRSRVARHLKALLIPGVMGMGACNKCGETSVVCDPMPPPMQDDAGMPQETADAAPPPVVCDPMPAPSLRRDASPVPGSRKKPK
jgi:hypothetical protein